MQRLANAVNEKVDQMRDAAAQAVKSALKSGEKVLFIGQYGKGLNVVMRVTKPASWSSETWKNRKDIDCVIPADKVVETIAWVKRNYPTAAIRMAD